MTNTPRDSLWEEENLDFQVLSTEDLSNNGLQLHCLDCLASGCPNLEDLMITVQAGPTQHLFELQNSFRSLRLLTFDYPFLNYAYPGFILREVVLYLTSLLSTLHMQVEPVRVAFHEVFAVEVLSKLPEREEKAARSYYHGLSSLYKDIEQQLDVARATQTDLLRQMAAHGPGNPQP